LQGCGYRFQMRLHSQFAPHGGALGDFAGKPERPEGESKRECR